MDRHRNKIVEAQTTSEEMRPEDFDGANEAIASLLPELVVRVDRFFPSSVELPKTDRGDISPVSMLFPVSKGNRKEDIAQALRFVLPRTLNDLIKGLADALGDDLKQLQYLGPLRSFPPRHLPLPNMKMPIGMPVAVMLGTSCVATMLCGRR